MPYNTATPARVRHAAALTFFISAPLSLAMLLAWGFQVWPPMHARPYLVVMVYLLLLAITMGSGVVVSVAHCHITVSRSFAAGVRAARSDAAWPLDPASPEPLRLVD